MSRNIIFTDPESGLTYGVQVNVAGQVWNDNLQALENFDAANLADYRPLMVETPAGSCRYYYSVPNAVPAGSFEVFRKAGDWHVYDEPTSWGTLPSAADAAASLALTQAAAETVDTLTKATGDGDLAALKTTVDELAEAVGELAPSGESIEVDIDVEDIALG